MLIEHFYSTANIEMIRKAYLCESIRNEVLELCIYTDFVLMGGCGSSTIEDITIRWEKIKKYMYEREQNIETK